VLRHEIKVLLLFAGITVSWSLLVRPVTQVDSAVGRCTLNQVDP
jgi:hypothetical protein